MTATDRHDPEAPDEISMTLPAIEVRNRMARQWADRVGDVPWVVMQHFRQDVPALLAELERLLAVTAELAQAYAHVTGTRQIANEADARLREQLLAALGREDDGRTSLSDYLSHLVAQRDALKSALAREANR